MKTSVTAALAVFLLLAGPSAQATCPGPTAAVAALEPAVRLRFLNQKMRAELRPAQNWYLIYQSIYSVGTLAQLAVAPVMKPPDRVDDYVGAVGTLIGSSALTIAPLAVLTDAPLAKDAAPTADSAELCRMVTEAEVRFSRSAGSEAFGRGVLAHVGNAVVNVAVLLVLGLGYHRWQSGLIDFGVGMVLGESMILTQPKGLPPAWDAYRAGRI